MAAFDPPVLPSKLSVELLTLYLVIPHISGACVLFDTQPIQSQFTQQVNEIKSASSNMLIYSTPSGPGYGGDGVDNKLHDEDW